MTDAPYQKQWKGLLLNQRLLYGNILLLLIPYLALSANFPLTNFWAFLAFAFWLSFIVLSLKIMFWHCPRCKEYFFAGKLRVNLAQGICQNCELSKYEGSHIKRFGKRFGF